MRPSFTQTGLPAPKQTWFTLTPGQQEQTPAASGEPEIINLLEPSSVFLIEGLKVALLHSVRINPNFMRYV